MTSIGMTGRFRYLRLFGSAGVPRWLSAAQPIAIVGTGGGTKIVPSRCTKGKTSTVFHGYTASQNRCSRLCPGQVM